MAVEISSSKYKGIDCLVIENELVRACFLPTQGAKLSSLIYKPTGQECIYQSSNEEYPEAQYGQNYLLGDCAGVDEMFPNVDECFYDGEPWSGIKLPDHGEVWAIPWNYSIEADAITLTTHGVRLPYQLTKKVEFIQPQILRASYRLENLSNYPMDYIWAAHMMFRTEKGCQFNFPDGLEKAYATMSESQLIGRYGDTFNYPIVQKDDGLEYDVRIHRGPESNDYQKFYFADKVPEGWGEIIYPSGLKIRVQFPEDQVPYLGVVQGEGGELNLRCMFLEPCTGAFDRPDIAKLHGMNSVLEPNQEITWYLDVLVSKEEKDA